MLVEDGRLQEEKIPEKILNNMKLNGIHDPFHCDPSLLQ
jgi:hypothetical protein